MKTKQELPCVMEVQLLIITDKVPNSEKISPTELGKNISLVLPVKV